MEKVAEITLRLQRMDQILVSPGSVFHDSRMLNHDAEEFLTEEALAQPYRAFLRLKVYLPEDQADGEQAIVDAIHRHFSYRRKKSARRLKETLQLGWRSLLISIIFLGLIVSLILVVNKLLPEGGLAITFREILIILGWVALWRPADLLLYEWRQYKREAILFGMLEQCTVEVIATGV